MRDKTAEHKTTSVEDPPQDADRVDSTAETEANTTTFSEPSEKPDTDKPLEDSQEQEPLSPAVPVGAIEPSQIASAAENETSAAPQEPSAQDQAHRVLNRLAVLKRRPLDGEHLEAALRAQGAPTGTRSLNRLLKELGYEPTRRLDRPRPEFCPMLYIAPGRELGVILGRELDGQWIIERFGAEETEHTRMEHLPKAWRAYRVNFQPQFVAMQSTTWKSVLSEVFQSKSILLQTALATLCIGLLALSVSLFSMQVYDRVIPSSGYATLRVLLVGVLAAILFEVAFKFARRHLIERITDRVDQTLARSTFTRFLQMRIDQMPQSVGSASQVLRGYEMVRNFLMTAFSHVMVDAPVGLFLLAIIVLIGGPLALVPGTFLVIGVSLAVIFKRKVEALTDLATPAQNRKTGLLVEAIEAAETIQAGNSLWRVLSRWVDVTDDARQFENQSKHISEQSQYLIAMFQQASYTIMIATGALMVVNGTLTMGGLLGCAILSGRVLTPIAALPNLLMSWAHARTAARGLDDVLKPVHDVSERPSIYLDDIKGSYRVEDVEYHHDGSTDRPSLSIERLQIRAGERIAVIGPIGAGKSTLLRLLAGLYAPSNGSIYLDDVDIGALSRATLAQSIGYLPQDGRLISGTLRENLLLGVPDPGDAKILEVCKASGLYEALIATGRMGLDRLVQEGGTGLSGGQKQLLQLTRCLLRDPPVWLLDEPTASMDQGLEATVLSAFDAHMKGAGSKDTYIFVTHKSQVLRLVDRVIVIAGGQVTHDGPRDEVLGALRNAQQKTQSKPRPAASVSDGE